ncbi:hypothetical protein WDU94_011628 [Cyamophila willieti]
MAFMQTILAIVLTQIYISKKSSTQVLAQFSYPPFHLPQGVVYEPPPAYSSIQSLPTGHGQNGGSLYNPVSYATMRSIQANNARNNLLYNPVRYQNGYQNVQALSQSMQNVQALPQSMQNVQALQQYMQNVQALQQARQNIHVQPLPQSMQNVQSLPQSMQKNHALPSSIQALPNGIETLSNGLTGTINARQFQSHIGYPQSQSLSANNNLLAPYSRSFPPVQVNGLAYSPSPVQSVQANGLPYQPPAPFPTPQPPEASNQLLANALNLRKQKVYKNFLLNRLLREKGMISREEYLRNLKRIEETYRQLLRLMYYAIQENTASSYAWDSSRPTSTTALPSSPETSHSTKSSKYQKFKLKFKPDKSNKPVSFNQFVPEPIIPVMRSVPNPDSINNDIVNLALSEPLREKITNSQLRRPGGNVGSGEYLDTLRFQKQHQGNSVQVNMVHNQIRKNGKEDNGAWEFGKHAGGFKSTHQNSNLNTNRRSGYSGVQIDEKKKYSSKISTSQIRKPK